MPHTWILLLFGVIANAPILWGHFLWMSIVQHFQFFPFAIAAAGALLYSRRTELGNILQARSGTIVQTGDSETGEVVSRQFHKPNPWVLFVGFGINAVVLLFCTLVGLSLLAWCNFLFFLVLLVYATYGRDGLWVIVPSLVTLLIMRPLPRGLEDRVTTGMQQLASNLSSYLLDGLGVLHYRSGVVLALANQSFMAEEACSGIRSLFSSITAIVVWGLFNHYHWFRHFVNVAQTVLWVLVFNALRIMLVVFVADKTSFDIATGWAHATLGLVIFLLIFAMVLSTDQLISGLFSKIKDEEFDIVTAETSSVSQIGSWTDWLRWDGASTQQKFWIGVFGILALLSIRLEAAKGFSIFSDTFSEQSMLAPTVDFLPPKIDDWSVQDFEHVHRTEANEMGSDSYRWTLTNGPKTIIVSVDGVFLDHHDLTTCYYFMGWKVQRDVYYDSLADQQTGVQGNLKNLTELTMSKLTGETGMVLFSAVDRVGKIVPPGDRTYLSMLDRIIVSLKTIVGLQSVHGLNQTFYTLPISTIQVVYQPTNSISETDATQIQEIFFKVRELLLKSPRFSSVSK